MPEKQLRYKNNAEIFDRKQTCGLEKLDLRPKRADLKPERADLGPGAEKIDFRFGRQIAGLRGLISGQRGWISGLSGQISGQRGPISGLGGQILGLRGQISGVKGLRGGRTN